MLGSLGIVGRVVNFTGGCCEGLLGGGKRACIILRGLSRSVGRVSGRVVNFTVGC